MEDFIFKVVIFGDGGVGKSTLIKRYLSGTFDEGMKITIGVDFHIQKLEIENNRITLQLWDFAGEDRFRMLLPSYMRGAKGGIFMYDVTRYTSLKNLGSWLEVVRSMDKTIPLIMVGSKIDLEEFRSVESDYAMELATKHEFLGYAECSSKTGVYVEGVFDLITRIILENQNLIQEESE
jgi:small GTP-binding protein